MNKLLSKIRDFLLERPVLSVLILFSIISIFIAPNFLTSINLLNILKQASSLAIVACGVTFVVLNGGIDFSSTSVIALSSVVGASIMTTDNGLMANSPFAVLVSILAMLIIGIIFGVINGISVIKFRMPSFIVTLATMMIGSGIAVWYTKAETIYNLPKSFNFIGSGKILFIPIAVLIAAVMILIMWFILSKTLYGRQVYAVGTNPKASFISGIPVKKTILKMFIISGICASISGVVMTAQLESGAPGLGSNMFLDIIASIIIGGTSIYGGSGTIIGTVIGVLFLTVMNNSLNLMSVSWFIISVIKGLIILIAAFSDVIKIRIVEK